MPNNFPKNDANFIPLIFDFLRVAAETGPGETILVVVTVIAFAIFVISSTFIFPIFVYVYRKNWKNEEKSSSVYPITNHFYHIVMFMQIYNLCFIAVVFLITQSSLPIDIILVLLFTFSYIISCIILSVQNLLLFLLAFQRFLIYFLPGIDACISPKRSTFQRVLIYIYVVVILGNVVLRSFKFVCYWKFIFKIGEYGNCVGKWDLIYMKVYFISEALVVVSAIFYFCIFISVRKISKSKYFVKAGPEKYIFFQTILIVVVKMTFLPIFAIGIYNEIMDLEFMFYFMIAISIFTTSFVIQISYLFGNRSNFEMVSTVKFWRLKTWMVLCGGEDSSAVEPENVKIETMITK